MTHTAPKSLAETKGAPGWLANFSAADRPAAKRLLEGVTVIGETAFRADMKRLIAAVASSMNGEKVAVFATQGLPSYLPLTAFYSDPSQFTPSGSELIVENIVRKSLKRTGFIYSPSVAELLKQKVDVLLFVGDVLASGDEVTKFIDFFYRNPAIRSWHSSHHIRFQLVAHTLSDRASEVLKNDRRISELSFLEMDRTLDRAPWSAAELSAVEDICVRYSDSPAQAFGRGDVRSLVAFGHTFGNGLPRVLLQRKGPGGKAWSPLLPASRDYGLEPEDELRTSGYRPLFDATLALTRMLKPGRSRRLQRQELVALSQPVESAIDEGAIAKLLVALRLRFKTEQELMRATGLDTEQLRSTLSRAIALGLITSALVVTKAGASFIRRSGRRPEVVTLVRASRASLPYYPQQLR